MKRVLFVDDEPRILDGLRRMLRVLRNEWDMEFAEGGARAIEVLAAHRFDVIVSDMRMPGIDGAELLLHCKRHHPDMMRIVLSGHMELESALRSIAVAHQFLTKPCDADTVRKVLNRSAALQDLLGDPSLRAMLTCIQGVPISPRTHFELTAALDDPEVSIQAVARIIEPNPALTAMILQLVNSAFLGLPHQVSNMITAIHAIGLTMLRNLVLYFEIVQAMQAQDVSTQFSFEAHGHHATRVARLACELAQGDRAREAAFTAGMLHDLGELIFAVRSPLAHEALLARARSESRPLADVEYEHYGFSHAEVGAYLLGLWGLPHAVVEAVAHHHRPARVPYSATDALIAVHAADALVRELDGPQLRFDGGLGLEYLSGVLPPGTLDSWRARARALFGTEELSRAR